MTKAASTSHFRDVLTSVSRARYVVWRLLGARNPISLRLNSSLLITMRPHGTTTDYGVAFDVFLRNCYQSPEPISDIQHIVDLGANVGYSCLFWCWAYPCAQVIAFEPHPTHVIAITGHLAANRFSDRVQVVEAAAGVAKADVYLSDAGSSSTINSIAGGYAVPIVDFFEAVKGPIDILKIDIEGGEYDLLADERFRSLGARIVVVEWHKKPGHPDCREWCRERLQKFGYRTSIGTEDLPMAGLIWGFRDKI